MTLPEVSWPFDRVPVSIPTWRPEGRVGLPEARTPRALTLPKVQPLSLLAALLITLCAFIPASPAPQFGGGFYAGESFLATHPVVVAADRMVCSMLGSQQSRAGVIGEDGGHSVGLGGVVFWNFGDTVLSNGGLNPNGIGWSGDRSAADCITLVPGSSAGGAASLLPKADDGELTVWPLGMEATSPDRVHFFYASIVGEDEVDSWQVAGVGLASFDTGTLTADRAFDGLLPWPAGGPLPFRTFSDDEYVYIFLDAASDDWETETILARAPKATIESLSTYQFWQPGIADGGTWVSGLWDDNAGRWSERLDYIEPLWTQPGRHNGIEVAYNEYLDSWLAIYASGFMTSVSVKAADKLTGPWDSAETPLIDCPAFHPDAANGFVCYSGVQHEIYSSDGGRTIYVSYSNGDDYQVYLHEIRLAAAVTQWSDARGRAIYVAGKEPLPGSFAEDGLAFYAADIPTAGFSAIHRWLDVATGQVRYGATRPGAPDAYRDLGIDFYAPADGRSAATTNAAYAPVYRWTRDSGQRYSPLNLMTEGYARQELAFYAGCPDADVDGLSDCVESFIGTDPMVADTDGDALPDGYERAMDGCDALRFDEDGDGVGPLDEVLAGRNPCVRDGRGLRSSNYGA